MAPEYMRRARALVQVSEKCVKSEQARLTPDPAFDPYLERVCGICSL